MKKLTALLLIIFLFVGALNGVAIAHENDVKVYLDGVLLEFDVQPLIISGRTMVPMRKIFEELGTTVHWLNDGAYEGSQTILATNKDAKGIWLQIGNPELHIVQDVLSSNNGKDKIITLDVPPRIIDGRALVPIRAVAESFDANVVWDEKSFSVIITTESEDDSLETMKANGKFVVGIDESFPPVTFKDEYGNCVGFGIDLSQIAASELGVDLQISPMRFDDLESALKANKIDAIWTGLTITPERMDNMLFSEPYITNPLVFIVKSDSDIFSKQNLMGKTIGYQTDSAIEGRRDKYNSSDSLWVNSKQQRYSKIDDAVSALSKGGIDAVLADKVTAQYITKDSSLYRLIDGEYDIEEWGVGFRINDKTLRDAVQKVLSDMFTDGSYTKIYEKWFGVDTLARNTDIYSGLFGTRTTKKFSLINNRLQVYLPEFSQDIAIQNGIMSPWSSNEEDTRIVIERYNKKLVLYLYEPFILASDNLKNDAQTILISQYESQGTLKSPYSNGKIQNVQLIPDIYDGTDGITVREAIIKTQDGLLVYAAVIATHETFNSDKDGCIETAESMINSISEGGRVVERAQRTGSIKWPGYTILLKQDYVLTLSSGIDFDVYYVQKIVKPGELQPYMGIYVGGHPSFSADDRKVSENSKILGQNIKWYLDQETKNIDAETKADTLIKVSEGEYPLYMHIFARPGTENSWSELKKMAESLTWY